MYFVFNIFKFHFFGGNGGPRYPFSSTLSHFIEILSTYDIFWVNGQTKILIMTKIFDLEKINYKIQNFFFGFLVIKSIYAENPSLTEIV